MSRKAFRDIKPLHQHVSCSKQISCFLSGSYIIVKWNGWTMAQLSTHALQWNPSKLHFEFPLPDRELRFKELVVYISDQCLDDPTFSKVKLFKVLFYSDFEAYGHHGKPITGVSYKKLPLGPAPAIYERMQEEMVRDRLIRVVERRVIDHSRQRVLPLKEPSFDLFEARQISLVDEWIRFFWNKTAKEISEFSHGKAWKLANMYELIPYEAVFISDDPVTYEDVDRVKELAAKFGWKL